MSQIRNKCPNALNLHARAVAYLHTSEVSLGGKMAGMYIHRKVITYKLFEKAFPVIINLWKYILRIQENAIFYFSFSNVKFKRTDVLPLYTNNRAPRWTFMYPGTIVETRCPSHCQRLLLG